MSSAITRNKMKDGVGDWIVLISGVNTENEDWSRDSDVRKEILEFNHKERNIITRDAHKQ